MYDIKPTTHVRRCGRCGGKAVTTGICGPTNICDACADALLAVIWGEDWPAIRDHTRGHGRVTAPEVPAGRNRQRRRHRRAA